MMLLPLAAVLMFALFFGRGFLYAWAVGSGLEHGVAGRAAYLRTPLAFGRLALTVAAWAAFAWFFRKASLEQDDDPRSSLSVHRRLTRYAALFLLVFAPSFTLAS